MTDRTREDLIAILNRNGFYAVADRLRVDGEEIERLKAFARTILYQGPFAGHDLDGYDVQCIAIGHGLIEETTYDPEKHGPNSVDAEPGDPWFVFSAALGDGK